MSSRAVPFDQSEYGSVPGIRLSDFIALIKRLENKKENREQIDNISKAAKDLLEKSAILENEQDS